MNTPCPVSDKSNYRKFQNSNPVVKFLLNNFYSKVRDILSGMEFNSVLDAGCGEGMTLKQLSDIMPRKVTAFDIVPECVEFAKQQYPSADFLVSDITETPFEDKTFDAAISLEVLEHLPEPGEGIKELLRITRKHIILSVPHEPYFTLGSFLRGKYLRRSGRHPEHIQAWNSNSFSKFLAECNTNHKLFKSFPWLIAVIDI